MLLGKCGELILGSIIECRVCKSNALVEVLHLGVQPLSGVFPDSISEPVTSGPLRLVWCTGCQLIQLGESFPHLEMYGKNYGYKSNLNPSMVEHLQNIAEGLIRKLNLNPNSLVCDIGSNDGTFLKFFSKITSGLVGIDPTIVKYSEQYDKNIIKIPNFFSAQAYHEVMSKKANLITSIAMFYDLEDPVEFARDIGKCLAPGGHWFFEQSYAPWMLSSGAYDTVCHEHLEYYSLTSIKHIMDDAGFEICEVSTNNTNGGSISILACRGNSTQIQDDYGRWLLKEEYNTGANSLENWKDFGAKVVSRKKSLISLIEELSANKKTIYALGASTKGNILMNYSGITSNQIPQIGEINSDKWNKFTPGSHIPIVNEEQILSLQPDYLLFLPWHFRDFAVKKYNSYLRYGGKFIFPLPDVEVVSY